jgi:hypothetical protein
MLWAIGIASFVVAVMLEGWAISVLWGWFMVPAFGLPELRIPFAVGLALIVGMLTYRVRKDEDVPDTAHLLVHGLVTPFVFLAIGWFVKLAV